MLLKALPLRQEPLLPLEKALQPIGRAARARLRVGIRVLLITSSKNGTSEALTSQRGAIALVILFDHGTFSFPATQTSPRRAIHGLCSRNTSQSMSSRC